MGANSMLSGDGPSSVPSAPITNIIPAPRKIYFFCLWLIGVFIAVVLLCIIHFYLCPLLCVCERWW